jgi:3',5'-cyclic AMP phosphodiesterase CpdA
VNRAWVATFALVSALALGPALPPLLAQPDTPVTLIAYADARFTDPVNTVASRPHVRTALIEQIAAEKPDAIVLSGDMPWRGGVEGDYARFRQETEVWRTSRLRIIPALGNHELALCVPVACLESWWTVFPELRGTRWHVAEVSPHARVFALDSTSPLTAGSDQREWLEREVRMLPASVQFVVVALHHPPVADVQTRLHVDHNPRPNELALADYLAVAARATRARFVVVAGHIHNYERFLQDDVVYLVAGGGGADPYEVDRTPADLYQERDFPNFHYVKLTMANGTLTGEMYRLDDPEAAVPRFTVKDTFTVQAR